MLRRITLYSMTMMSFLILTEFGESAEPINEAPPIISQSLILSVEGAEIEAKVWGGGEVIIAIPGLGADIAYFDLIGPLIAAEGFQIVALNPRGIGNSSGPLNDLTMDILAQDVVNAIQALGIEKAHLLGWAFGNRVARIVAQNYPQRVETVMLLAAGGLVPPSDEVGRAFQRLSEPGLSNSTRIQLLRESLFAPKSDIAALQAAVLSGTWPEARAAQIAAIRASNIDDWWSGGNAQMLIVQGRYDVIAPAQNGFALVEEFPNRTKLVWVEDAAHMMLVEQPETVAGHVVEFLQYQADQ